MEAMCATDLGNGIASCDSDLYAVTLFPNTHAPFSVDLARN